MFNNVSNVSSSYFISQLKENGCEKKISLKDSFSDTVQLSTSPAFKGQATAKVAQEGTKAIVKKLPVVLAAIAGFLGIKSVKDNAAPKETASTKNIEKLLDNYRKKYPEIMEVLDSEEETDNPYSTTYRKLYSAPAKVAIMQRYEEDPEKGYKLAKILKYDTSKVMDEATVSTLENNYEEVVKYSGLNLYDKVQVMNLAKENPLIDKIARYRSDRSYYRMSPEDLAMYSEFCTDEEKAQALTETVKYMTDTLWHRVNSNTAIRVAQLKLKYPNMSKALFETICRYDLDDENMAVIERNIENPEKLVNYVSKYGFKGAGALVDLNETHPQHLKLAMNVREHAHKLNDADVKHFTENLILAEELFNESKDKSIISGVIDGALYEHKEKYFVEDKQLQTLINTLDADKIKQYKRMIADGRCAHAKQMLDLLPIYEKYPNEVITNEMIENFKDPLRKAMGLF